VAGGNWAIPSKDGVPARYLAATSATIGTIARPSCALLIPYCADAVIICRDISSTGRLRASAQISRRSTSTESRGTTLSRAGTRLVIDSATKLEFHRQAKVMRRGSHNNPNKYRRTELVGIPYLSTPRRSTMPASSDIRTSCGAIGIGNSVCRFHPSEYARTRIIAERASAGSPNGLLRQR